MSNTKFKKIVIIGTGLIGGSVGKALLEKGLADEVVGVCRRQSTLERGIKEKAFTKGFVDNYAEAVSGADIVVIATPVHTIKQVLKDLADVLKGCSTLVTDAGSTKKEIVEYAAQFKDDFTFVGAHPLAGSEKMGVEYAASDLFQGSVCIITPGDEVKKEDKDSIEDFWRSLGAKMVTLAPEEHDRNLAISSHLPHVVAYALAGMLGEGLPAEMIATGFKDTTRIASSDPGLWSDIFMTNRDNVLKALDKYKDILSGIEKGIKSGSEEDLQKILEVYKRKRDEIV